MIQMSYEYLNKYLYVVIEDLIIYGLKKKNFEIIKRIILENLRLM